MVSGCCSSLITPASERIKCLLQVQAISATNSYKFHGTIHCVRTLYKQGGFASLYKGTYATLMRDIPSTGIYFASYELIKDACATNET
jgi:solute carrier family 25 carnitine/acylcarnitine transporter 20/29